MRVTYPGVSKFVMFTAAECAAPFVCGSGLGWISFSCSGLCGEIFRFKRVLYCSPERDVLRSRLMIQAGINSGDVLVVDCSLTAHHYNRLYSWRNDSEDVGAGTFWFARECDS